MYVPPQPGLLLCLLSASTHEVSLSPPSQSDKCASPVNARLALLSPLPARVHAGWGCTFAHLSK